VQPPVWLWRIALNFKPLRFLYGAALIAVLFAPFGIYHSFSEASVMGTLWGYHLPIGYLGLALGLAVMAYPRAGLTKKLSFASFMVITGFLLIATALLTPEEYFVSLIHGGNTNPAMIDIDYPIGNWLVWGLTLFSVTAGLLLRIRENRIQRTD
jgi:hypothetical protein